LASESQIVALGQMLTNFVVFVDSKQMQLALSKPSICSRQTKKGCGVPASHIGKHHHPAVALENIGMVEP
jgi:hypothetical protein